MSILQWVGKYWGALLLSAGAVGWFYVQHLDALRNQRAKYTIGYLTGYHYVPKQGIHYDFRFTTNDSAYEGTSLSDKGMATENGSRFLVKYDSMHPGRNVGYFALAIPDSIHQAPPRGWLTPPIPVPAWILDRGKK